MTRERSDSDQARVELYRIMRADLTFEEKVDRALELGEAHLDVQNAHLTRIDEHIDFWEVVASTDPPDGAFPPGEVFDLQTTYCRQVVEREATVALSDAPEQGWGGDPAFEEHGLRCYHGTPIAVENELWGTLCFVSEESRGDPFTESETLFAELIARLIEQELRTARQQSEISLQSNLIGVLTRVLRHNLRNDLNVIRAHLTMRAEPRGDGLLQTETAVQKIDKLVGLADTARKIESIASADLDRQPVELNALVENVIKRVGRTHPNASFTLEAPDEVYTEAFPPLQTGLEELVENAAKHSGESPRVTVSIDEGSDDVVIDVIDNGPGLPQEEREVLREGSESPLIHGSGLGLWLSAWIVAHHGGSVETEVTGEGTRISVTLPKTSSPSEVGDSEFLLSRFHREQDKFEAVFEESFDAIVLLDDDGRYTDVNESAAELFGVPRAELRGRSVTEFAADDFDAGSAWTELMDTDRDRSTFTLVRPDGTERIVEYTAVTDIVPGQHLAILRDATERIERERELLETKDRLEAIIDASPDPILVIDDRGVIERWNDAAEEVFGYEADEVVGEPLQAVGLHGDSEAESFADQFERAMSGERFDDLVVSRQTKDGNDIRVSLSTAPLYDCSGGVTGLVGVAQDVTARLERARRFEALSKGFPDLCFVLDQDGVYREVLANPANENLLIGDPDELVGQAVTDVFPNEKGRLVRRNIDRAIETGESQTARFELEVPAGHRVFEARTHPLSETAGEKRAVSMVVRDITRHPSGQESAASS